MSDRLDAATRHRLAFLLDASATAIAAVFAVALLKLGMATGFVEQQHPGFAKEVEEKRQRVIAALTQKH